MDKPKAYKVIVVAPDGTTTEASGSSVVCVIQERSERGNAVKLDLHSMITGPEQDYLDMVLHLIESIELKGCDNFVAAVQRKLKDDVFYSGYIRA